MIPDRERYELKKKLERVDRQNHFRLAAGILEFGGVVAGIVCSLVLLALLFSLLNWLRQDIGSTLAIFQSHFQ
ncbi:MAG: hypothetical protein E7326_07065 [Clostridiales bacterium]|nr:hypothetical protein [Clostridiales bacterium]